VRTISIVEVPNRYLAGITEVALKTIMQIKPTGVLTNNVEQIDLVAERLKVENLIPTEVQEYLFNDLYEMHYPVLEYPAKVNSLSLDKTPHFQGKLTGIKGQYLLLKMEAFNIRSEGCSYN
jgi:hypothetical protein